jgi:signal transduction histidine kinase
MERQLEIQQKESTAAVIKVQKNGRALVSRELHDNVNQVLTTVKLYTELCRDGIENIEDIMEK